MSSADEAAAALRASKAINQGQQVLTDESRVLLASLLRDEMRVAVAEGITAAMTDEAARRFTLAMLETLQEQAAQRAGMFVLGGLKKALGIAVIVLAVWMFLGAPAAKAVFGAFTKG